MKCNNCGRENKDDSKFCEECGAKLEVEKQENNNEDDNIFYSYNVNYQYEKKSSNIDLKIIIVLLVLLIFATITFGFWYFILRDTSGNKNNNEVNNTEIDKPDEPDSTPTPVPIPDPTAMPTQDPTPMPTAIPDNNDSDEVVCEYTELGAVSRMIGKLNNNKITRINMEMILMSNEIAQTFYDQLKEINPDYNYVLDGNKVYLEDVQELEKDFQVIIGLSKEDFIEFVNSGQTGMDITCR